MGAGNRRGEGNKTREGKGQGRERVDWVGNKGRRGKFKSLGDMSMDMLSTVRPGKVKLGPKHELLMLLQFVLRVYGALER